MKLFTLEGENTRPTLNRVKETVFNILAFDLVDKSFLDLFAGSGAIGLEALSRGSKSCIFLDNSKEAINVITKNVKKAKFEEKAKIINKDFVTFLENSTETYDVIYLDPPYNKDLHNIALGRIMDKNLLNKKGIVVVEVAKDDEIELKYVNDLTLYREKKFKSFDIYFYRNE